jgi:outer membrane receptor protein involved in Fe transport
LPWISAQATGLKNWTTFSQAFGNPTVDIKLNTYGFYGQDQFRITPDIVLNYGVRYDYTAIPQPSVVNPDYPQTGKIHCNRQHRSPRRHFLQVELQTSVRAGYGCFSPATRQA